MNIRALANAAVQAINPDQLVGYVASTGASINAAGKQVPTYAASVPTRAQVQAVTGKMLEHVQPISQQSVFRNVRTIPNVQGLVRVLAKGGDLFTFPMRPTDTQVLTWKVVHVLETWPEWCSVVVALQNDPVA